MPHVPAFLVAGTKSGCGKTSVSLGLMAAFARRGLAVQPFKAGPDFIDPGHHARAASLGARAASPSIESHNLDTWMLSRDAVRSLFARHAASGDVVVVEGVMGLFDGVSGLDEQGSSAHLAKTLGLPVVLVADASSLARSAAALVKGYAEFDPDLKMAGVILNNVASDNHADLLRQALSQVDAPLLGLLPRQESIRLPSRHLGLHTAEEGAGKAGGEGVYHGLADWVEAHLDLDGLLAGLDRVAVDPPASEPAPAPLVRLGVARDQAFCFLYPENLRLLRAAGAEIVFFSPLADRALPDGLDGLYFPGGYPELHAEALEANAGLRGQVLDFARSGRPVYAECGGFMYLMRALADRAGRWYSMAGVFDVGAEMGGRFVALGYRKVETRADTLLGPAGTTLRGHEFHYSRLAAQPAKARPVYRVTGRDDRVLETTGWQKGGVLGSYVHLHFGSNPEAAANFVRAMQG